MAAYVADVNVPVAANGRGTSQVSPQCRLTCIRMLQEALEGTVCLDTRGEILAEYRGYLNPSGQPGVGDLFMERLVRLEYTRTLVERVTITPVAGPRRSYEEFPDDPELARFDPSDRKYIAVAIASANAPEILNALDSDYQEVQAALRRNGVTVRELCPDCLRRGPWQPV